MLELWKPLLILKDKDNPVVFTDLGFKYTTWDKILNKEVLSVDVHPFIIFYDEKDDCYYYLKSRGAYKKDNKTYKPKNEHEIIVRSSTNNGLFFKDSYVDCSQIFKCDRELLESLIDVDCQMYKDTLQVRDVQKINILEEIREAIFEVPPYLSIIEVDLDEGGNTYGKSLYLCDKKIDVYFDLYYDLDPEIEEYIRELDSNKNSEFKYVKDRYNNGIEFSEMFLKEYFSDQLDMFYKIQDIDNDQQKEPEKER